MVEEKVLFIRLYEVLPNMDVRFIKEYPFREDISDILRGRKILKKEKDNRAKSTIKIYVKA